MSSKIPSLIRPTNLRKPSEISNQIKTGAKYHPNDNLKGSNIVKLSKNDDKENYYLSSKFTPEGSKNNRVPRVAYLSGRPQNNNSATGINHTSKVIPKKDISNNIYNIKPSQNNLSRKVGVSRPNVKTERIIDKGLSIRQQKLIKERESRLENTNLRLEKADDNYSQELLLSRVIESELKLQLEYLDESNARYLEEIKTILELENELNCEIFTLENQLNVMESTLSNLKNIKNIRASTNDFKIQNLDIEQTIQLISEEISDCENSIKCYEFEGDDGELMIEKLRIPFNNSIELALNLEKLLQNDKLLINQLQFRLHKLTRSPKFVCRTYSTEIPQLSKVHIYIPSCERIANVDNELGENTGKLYSQKNEINVGSAELKLEVDIRKSQFSIGMKTVKFDKIIEFDETKRPSTLLLTDLSRIDKHISNIIMQKIDDIPKRTGIQAKNNKNNIIRRQSLLHSKMEFEANQNGSHIDSKDNTNERNTYYLVDINEQKEVEMDILLLINDFFNCIKLVFVEKSDSHDQSKASDDSYYEIPPIFITNIGPNSTASRQTFWGTNDGRIVLINDGTRGKTDNHLTGYYNKKIPGILHSVIHQIYQNINSSSLFDWKFSANILIQDSKIGHRDVGGICQVDFRAQQAYNQEIIHVSNRGLAGYVFSPGRNLCLDRFYPSHSSESNYGYDRSMPSSGEGVIYESNTISNRDFGSSEEFISQLYREIQLISPNLLSSINAYCLKETQINIPVQHPGSHIIIILKIEAIASNSSISSNIVLTDLFIDDNGTADYAIIDYLSIISGNSHNNMLMDRISQLKTNCKVDPLIYTLIHSET